MTFTTVYEEILDQLHQIDPINYAKTRNFIDGDVTRLSPYISRGVISTRMVMQHVLNEGHSPYQIEKFLQELAWRDYWQQIWIEKGDLINKDLKHEQPLVSNHEMPEAIDKASTGIKAIDEAIKGLYEHGYLHNHVRMYVAAMACNIGQSHWKVPAQWMYYHLLDGDWASNALSWQWVAGSNANKKYYANQANINKYCYTRQKGTFMDVEYEDFNGMNIPYELSSTALPSLETPLPAKNEIKVSTSNPTLLYNYYNLDPEWRVDEDMNRVLLIEPSVFAKYPVSQNGINFMMGLAKNIPGIQVFVGEFHELNTNHGLDNFIFKEHPLNGHYEGTEEQREWMFGVKGYFPSFFAFWKKCRKELKTKAF
jgi:deoxyribodipyrimidine photo-lyase